MQQTDRGTRFLSTLLVAALAWSSWGVAAQGLTEGQGAAILDELKQIRQLLERIERQDGGTAPQRRRRPVSAKISTAGSPALGDSDAPVTLVEFTDFECPYCNRFFINTWPKLVKGYVDTGMVRVVIKDMPLGFHKNARKAAQATHCAGEQDAYWPMHDTLYRNARKLDPALLPEYAKILSLDVDAFKACLESDRHLEAIDADASEAKRSRITSAPSFVIGKTADDFIEGTLIVGAQRYQVFESQIRAVLDSTNEPRP
ncbi:MAG: thioredoxin domain-containing protein [Pseudomonadota bacterium]|nr:thioredoxin domain-containing protein [Pseudomonadota bacterium]